eukprot:2871904-Rhodomonas_salina.1
MSDPLEPPGVVLGTGVCVGEVSVVGRRGASGFGVTQNTESPGAEGEVDWEDNNELGDAGVAVVAQGLANLEKLEELWM